MIKADELDPSPRTIRGGSLSPSNALARSYTYGDDEAKEKRLSDRKRSLDLLGSHRHESSESPLLLGGQNTPITTANSNSAVINAIATEDSLEPQMLVMPPSPLRTNSSNGRPPRPPPSSSQSQSSQSSSGAQNNQQSNTLAKSSELTTTTTTTSNPPADKPSSQNHAPSSGPGNQGNACCVIS